MASKTVGAGERRWPGNPTRLSAGLPLLLCLVAVAALWSAPTIYSNEAVYLLGGKRLAAPEFLQADWSQAAHPLSQAQAAFNAVSAVAWLVTDKNVAVAMSMRGVCWLLLLLSLATLARQLELQPWYAAVGFTLWLAAGQGMTAGEWIIGGAESKCIAYAAMFYCLVWLLRGRPGIAAACAALGTTFHVLVGGWGTLCIGLAYLVGTESGQHRLREHARVVGIWLVLALPALVNAALFGAGTSPEINEALVEFRNPHHAQPGEFMSAGDAVAVVVLSLGALWAAYVHFTGRTRKVILATLAGACALFALGLCWAAFDLYGLLKLLPFRLPDALVPLAFWVLVPHAVVRAISARRWRPARTYAAMAAAAIALLWMARGAPGEASKRHRTTRIHWKRAASGTTTQFEQATRWIRENTDRDATFVVNPCHGDFWLRARRAMVVNFKSTPTNGRFLEWRERLEAVHGGPFRVRGTAVCRALRKRFKAMDAAALDDLAERYGAELALLRLPSALPAESPRWLYKNARYGVWRID